MGDLYSNLENVNDAVQQAGVGDKRNRNLAIRKGMENPGLFMQSVGSQPIDLSQTLSSIGTQPIQQEQTQPIQQEQTQPIQQEQTQPRYQSDIDNWNAPQTWSASNSNLYQDPKYATSRLVTKPSLPYEDINKISKQFYNAGFRPGNNVEGWTYSPDRDRQPFGRSGVTPTPGAGLWSRQSPEDNKTTQYIGYNPATGYNSKQVTDVGNAGDWDSVGLVASIIGGMVLPGLGTSWAGLASNAAQNLGLSSGSGLGGLFGGGGIAGTGISTGSSLLNSGIENFGKSLLTSGGDVKKAGINALSGVAGSGLGGLFDSDIRRYVSSMSKPLIGTVLSGGDMSEGLKNSLFGGASAGLGNLLNSTDLLSGNTQEKQALANNAVGLAKTLSQKRKVV